MIKLLPISVAKVLPRIELLPGLFLLLAPDCYVHKKTLYLYLKVYDSLKFKYT